MNAGDTYTQELYGVLEVLEYHTSRRVLVKFLSTGSTRWSKKAHIVNGRVKDYYMPRVFGVGFFGEGKYSQVKDKKAYTAWQMMLRRCYSEEYLLKFPTYRGCSVCKEWHNYQTFADWYYDFYIEGYSLDKDTRVLGNKCYSPDTCWFISAADNAIFANNTNHSFNTQLQEELIMAQAFTWTDEIKEEVSSIYKGTLEELVAANEGTDEADHSRAALENAAEAVGATVASARMQLTKLGVYVKVKPKASAKPKADGATGNKRVNKADAQAELLSAFKDGGATEVDEDIVSKLTGKAAAHIAEKIREILAAQ